MPSFISIAIRHTGNAGCRETLANYTQQLTIALVTPLAKQAARRAGATRRTRSQLSVRDVSQTRANPGLHGCFTTRIL